MDDIIYLLLISNFESDLPKANPKMATRLKDAVGRQSAQFRINFRPLGRSSQHPSFQAMEHDHGLRWSTEKKTRNNFP